MSTYAFRGNVHFIEQIQERLTQAGFTREGEVEAAGFVITYCTTMTQLEDLYFGEDGLLQRMVEGTQVIDMSPVTPNFADEMNAVATLSGFSMVTAPAVVRNKVAAHGLERENLITFCYGEGDALLRAEALLDAVFSQREERSSTAACQLARMTITIQDTAQIMSAVEALALSKGARTLILGTEVPPSSPAATTPMVADVLEAVAQKRFNGSYSVEMLMAELSSILMAADDHEIILPQVESAFHLLELLAVIGGASKSPAALALVYGSDHDGESYGLDWSRANALYQGDEGPVDEADEEGFDEEDDYLNEMFGISTGYSSN